MSHEKLVELIALRRGFEPLRADCTVVRTDGLDLARLIGAELRGRYAEGLASLPVADLPLLNVAAQVRLVVLPDGSAAVDLPEGTVRVANVKLSSWLRSVTPVADDHPLAAVQGNRWSRGGMCHPVAVWRGQRVYLYSPDRYGEAIELLEVVTMPKEGELFPVTHPLMEWIMKNMVLEL